jgi:hypothetical protein
LGIVIGPLTGNLYKNLMYKHSNIYVGWFYEYFGSFGDNGLVCSVFSGNWFMDKKIRKTIYD